MVDRIIIKGAERETSAEARGRGLEGHVGERGGAVRCGAVALPAGTHQLDRVPRFSTHQPD
jgi:hypothetical protein